MAQLFFNYGVMNSGKTIEILKVIHNYEVQDHKVLVLTSALDNRTTQNEVVSRIGLAHQAQPINANDDLIQLVNNDKPAIVLIDEAQFLTTKQVLELTHVVDDMSIPVMAFGLKNDALNNFFEGSKALLLYADKIEELKTICSFCTHKATMNLRTKNNQPVYSGSQIQIGGDDAYLPVCRHHYSHPGVIKTKTSGFNRK